MGGTYQPLPDDQALAVPRQYATATPVQPAPAQTQSPVAAPSSGVLAQQLAPQPDTQPQQHGFFHSLLNGLGNAALGVMPNVRSAMQTKLQNQLQKDALQRAHEDHDTDMAQKMQEFGATVVGGDNIVHRQTIGPDGTMGPAFLDKAGADGRQIVSHTTADGRKVQWELPSENERILLQGYRQAQLMGEQLKGMQPYLGLQAAQTRALKGAEAEGTESGKGRADASNPAYPVPTDAQAKTYGIAPGAHVTPEALKNYNEQDTATEALTERKRQAGWQTLGNTTDQPSYDAWRQAHPEAAAQTPATFAPQFRDALVRNNLVPVKDQPEYDIKKAQADAQKTSTPEGSDSVVDSIAPAKLYPEINASAKAQMRNVSESGLPVTAKAAILKDLGDKVAEIAKEKDPQVLAAKIKTEVAKQRALNALAPSALSNVDPKFYGPATQAYLKSGEEFAKAQTSAEDVQRVLSLAQHGNKAAGANVPLIGVGAVNAVNGIRRMSSAEIQQYGTAGSLVDKIQGRLLGWTEGKPIADDVLEDMKELHRQLSEGSVTKHGRDVQATNQTFGSRFQPMQFAPAPATTPSDGRAPLPQGGGKVIDKATAALFYKASSGDPGATRKAITGAGWKLQ